MDFMDMAYIGFMAESEGLLDDHVTKVARELKGNCSQVISQEEFEAACYRVGVSPNKFTQRDLDRMVSLMNK